MGNLNKATKEQRKLIVELMRLANDCPGHDDKERRETYQQEILQPLRDRIIAAA
jgi:hypothetical protein